MPKYDVEVTQSITCTVTVDAETPEAAHAMVNRRDFELPAREEWAGHKDWEYVVCDQDGRELGRDEEQVGYYGTAEGDDE